MAEPVRIDSAVSEVEVFRAGALVTRTASLDGPSWPDEIALHGLPLALDDESVRVSLSGAGPLPSVSDVRVTLALPSPGASLEPPSQKEIRDAEDGIASLKARLTRLDREDARLDRVQLRLPEPFANRPPRPAPAAAWLGALQWIEGKKAARLEERLSLQTELARAQEALARLRRADAEARAGRDALQDVVSKRVVFRLRDAGPAGSATLRLTYAVPGARWAPSYVLRLSRDGRGASLALRALVAQSSGEPWRGVRLTLSTADLHREAEIPELASLRIGRVGPPEARKAWREPPPGLEELFAALDEALARRPALPPRPQAPARDQAEEQRSVRLDDTLTGSFAMSGAIPSDADEGETVAKKLKRAARPEVARPATVAPVVAQAPAAMPPPPPAPMPAQPMMMRTAAAGASRSRVFLSAPSFDRGGGGADTYAEAAAPESAPEAEPPPPSFEPDAGALRYGDLALAAWDDAGRGRLRPVTLAERLAGTGPGAADALSRRLAEESARAGSVARLPLPAGAAPVSESAGAFDHRYAAEGAVDVPSDGRLHAVPLFARSAGVVTSLVVVPRESPEAVRIATLKNPLRVPLLAGPAEIYLEDEFLVSSPIRTVPAGAELTVGLGVEERLKVARNVTYAEESHGMLGGGTTLDHRVTIEVASRLPAHMNVDVRERVPTKGEHDKDVEIVVSDVSPAWSDFQQPEAALEGGKRWRFTLGAGESRTLSFRYQIRIDGKNELVGGNRRERAEGAPRSLAGAEGPRSNRREA